MGKIWWEKIRLWFRSHIKNYEMHNNLVLCVEIDIDWVLEVKRAHLGQKYTGHNQGFYYGLRSTNTDILSSLILRFGEESLR